MELIRIHNLIELMDNKELREELKNLTLTDKIFFCRVLLKELEERLK